MREILESRLEELRGERAQGQMMMAQIGAEMDRLASERQVLSANMLRISGAIQVLEETLRNTDGENERMGDVDDPALVENADRENGRRGERVRDATTDQPG
jgi:hypothetical protein